MLLVKAKQSHELKRSLDIVISHGTLLPKDRQGTKSAQPLLLTLPAFWLRNDWYSHPAQAVQDLVRLGRLLGDRHLNAERQRPRRQDTAEATSRSCGVKGGIIVVGCGGPSASSRTTGACS